MTEENSNPTVSPCPDQGNPPPTPTKSWLEMSFAERVARRLRTKLNLSERDEETIARYLEWKFWQMRYDMSTARGRRYDGRYDTFPGDVRELLRAAWQAGFEAAQSSDLTQAALRVVAALDGIHEANATGELRAVEAALRRLADAHSDLLIAARDYQEAQR